MLSLKQPPELGANVIPAHLTTLSVSWLNNQFKAVAIHRGEIEGAWECPDPIDGTGFEGLIREAIEQTEYRGHSVSLLLAHKETEWPRYSVCSMASSFLVAGAPAPGTAIGRGSAGQGTDPQEN